MMSSLGGGHSSTTMAALTLTLLHRLSLVAIFVAKEGRLQKVRGIPQQMALYPGISIVVVFAIKEERFYKVRAFPRQMVLQLYFQMEWLNITMLTLPAFLHVRLVGTRQRPAAMRSAWPIWTRRPGARFARPAVQSTTGGVPATCDGTYARATQLHLRSFVNPRRRFRCSATCGVQWSERSLLYERAARTTL